MYAILTVLPSPPPPSPPTNGDAGAPGKMLNVEDKTFYVVKATAESLVLLGDYLSIVINLELVVPDVMSRIIEFLKVLTVRSGESELIRGSHSIRGLVRWFWALERCVLPVSRISPPNI